MEFDIFQKLFLNTKVDFDKADGAQCVDLVQYWNRALGNQTPFTGNAIDLQGQTLNDFYTWVPNTPDGIPPKGAIVVFGEPYGKWTDPEGNVHFNGHVVVANGNGDTNNFGALEQNDSPDGSVQDKVYGYQGVIGWLIPKQLPVNYEVLYNEKREECDTNWNLFDAVTNALLGHGADSNNKVHSLDEDTSAIQALKTQVATPADPTADIKTQYPTVHNLFSEFIALLHHNK